MPSIAVHLAVGGRLADRLGIQDLPSYFCGVIAPDSVNVDGFASKEKRYKAHIRSSSLEQWKLNIVKYKHEHAADFIDCPDFFVGFLLHLYTDIAWDETVQPALFDFLRSKGFDESQLNVRKWDELKGFDRIISESHEYKLAIEQLKLAKPHAAAYVSEQLADRWREKIIALPYPYPPAEFLTDMHIEIAAERAFGLMTREN